MKNNEMHTGVMIDSSELSKQVIRSLSGVSGTPKIVIAYQVITQTAFEYQRKADARKDVYPNHYEDTATGLQAAAAILYGACEGVPELKAMLDQVNNMGETNK